MEARQGMGRLLDESFKEQMRHWELLFMISHEIHVNILKDEHDRSSPPPLLLEIPVSNPT
jgi:hypothetical protein